MSWWAWLLLSLALWFSSAVLGYRLCIDKVRELESGDAARQLTRTYDALLEDAMRSLRGLPRRLS